MSSNMSHVLEAAAFQARACGATHTELADVTAARMHTGDLEAADPGPFWVDHDAVFLGPGFPCGICLHAISMGCA